jgi:hypothetical protein
MVQAVIGEERPEGRLARDGGALHSAFAGCRGLDASKWFRGWRSDRRDALGPRRLYAQSDEKPPRSHFRSYLDESWKVLRPGLYNALGHGRRVYQDAFIRKRFRGVDTR